MFPNMINEMPMPTLQAWYDNEVSAETNMDQGKMQVNGTILEMEEDDFPQHQDSYLSKILQS